MRPRIKHRKVSNDLNNLENIPFGCFLCHFIKNVLRIKISRWAKWLISISLLFYLPYLELDIMEDLFFKSKTTNRREVIDLEADMKSDDVVVLRSDIREIHLEPNDGTMRTTTKHKKIIAKPRRCIYRYL